jgi:hypothetical protein
MIFDFKKLSMRTRIYIISGFAASFCLTACSESGGFGTAGKEDKKEEASGGSSDNSQFGVDDDDERLADEPAQVAGAFLTCAFMDSKEDVYNKVKRVADGNTTIADGKVPTVDIGCGFYDPKTYAKSNTAGLDMSWLLFITNKRKGLLRTRPGGKHFDAISAVPVRYILSAIEVKAEDHEGGYATRRRNISSISAFNAKSGFDAKVDLDPMVPNQSDKSGFDFLGLLREVSKIPAFNQNQSISNQYNGDFKTCNNCDRPSRPNSNQKPNNNVVIENPEKPTPEKPTPEGPTAEKPTEQIKIPDVTPADNAAPVVVQEPVEETKPAEQPAPDAGET